MSKNERIYLDTEYCYPGMSEASGRPSSADTRQIVQISAIRFSTDDGAEKASFDQLVTPTFEKKLPLFFVELTGITQKEVDDSGVGFIEAINSFKEFSGDTPIWTFDKDQEVIEQNFSYHHARSIFAENFVRVSALLRSWGVEPGKYSSGTLYKAAGLQMTGHVHNALHDVRSMAAAVHVLEQRAG